MAKNKKIPQSETTRQDKKQLKSSHQKPDPKPSWRFSTVDKGGQFAWDLDSQTEHEIIEKLRHFDSMEWREIEGKQHHAIAISGLSRAAQQRLTTIKQDDIDELFSFHLNGKSRIICIRDRHIAKLLWYDPDHKVCPAKKKHT